MITFASLCRHPAAFRSLTGHTPDAFEALFAEFAPAYQQRCAAAATTKRDGLPRQRAVGAGPHFTHDLKTRLIMALLWLRIYPTFEVLGFLFSLNKTNVHATVGEVLATLEALADFPFEHPASERKKLCSLVAVMDAFPDVRLVIDTKEQRIQRPKSSKENDVQKPYYSGKKKSHTLKNEIAVTPEGRIGAVSPSVPGGATHDLTLLRRTRLIQRLSPDDEGAMLDKGYEGIRKDHPQHRLYLPFKVRRNHALTEDEKAYNRKIAQYRVVVEHTNAQLNQFQALAQVYRHSLGGHTRVVRAVALLVDRRIGQQPLKTYPKA